MIKIGLIGTQSMHARAFAGVCNIPDEAGNYRFSDARVTAVYGVDDVDEHVKATMEKGNIPVRVASMEELYEHCNAFMILQRRGGEHLKYATELIKKGYPVFIDKPVCCSATEIETLKALAGESKTVICGGSGMKYNQQIRELKRQMEHQSFGDILGGSIHHSADMDSPYSGIFFYLPHAVEMMLELFGYDPKCVKTVVHSHDKFTVCVKYDGYMVNLVMSNCAPACVIVNGRKSMVTQIDSSDIFRETMGQFVHAIEQKVITRDVEKLVKHVAVILAVKESLEDDSEVEIS